MAISISSEDMTEYRRWEEMQECKPNCWDRHMADVPAQRSFEMGPTTQISEDEMKVLHNKEHILRFVHGNNECNPGALRNFSTQNPA